MHNASKKLTDQNNNTTTTTIRGMVKSILFRSESDGFTICVLDVSATHSETVKGYLGSLIKGEEIIAQGTWEIHQKFGRQFSITSFQKITPNTKEGLVAYLGSGLIKGIGPIYAQKMVDLFSTQVLDIIEHHPEKLFLIPGIGKARHEQIINSFLEQKEVSHIMLFLSEKGVSSAYATKIFKTYGKNAIEIISENPYRLAEDVWGIGFKIADEIAQKCGIEKHALTRVSSGILHVLTTNQTQGNVYHKTEDVSNATLKLLTLSPQEGAQIIPLALEVLKNQVKIKAVFQNTTEYLTTRYFYYAEKELGAKLKTLLNQSIKNRPNLDDTNLQGAVPFILHEKQILGIKTTFYNPVSIITGGPGTGKTTLIKTLLAILNRYNLSYLLTAPTGRAAKRIFESTNNEAITIHRLLEFDPMTRKFNKNESNPIKTDFIIIDEASMIDLMLAHALIKAVTPGTHVVFIGDVNQLPSVGPGNVLHDMIESNIIPCVRLTTIFRQSEQSMIVLNAHRINEGLFPFLAINRTLPEFIFIEETDGTKIPDHLNHIFHTILPHYKINADEAIILTPMHKGTAGTATINMHLQKLLNKKEQKAIFSNFGIAYMVGDRVMQLRNNYDKTVFNGDIGVIETIDLKSGEFLIRFLDRLVLYTTDEMTELTLAYAISIHKSQGSEYSAIIVPLFMQHFMMLQKNLLYTAITRAKKLCIFLGEKKAIMMALNNTKGTERVTFLKEYLTQ